MCQMPNPPMVLPYFLVCSVNSSSAIPQAAIAYQKHPHHGRGDAQLVCTLFEKNARPITITETPPSTSMAASTAVPDA
jgi:hypothetical protein